MGFRNAPQPNRDKTIQNGPLNARLPKTTAPMGAQRPNRSFEASPLHGGEVKAIAADQIRQNPVVELVGETGRAGG